MLYTNYIRTDGFGSQFQSVLWTVLYTELTGNMFVYTDIKNMDLISNAGTIKDTENENTLDEVIQYMGIKSIYPSLETETRPVQCIHFSQAYEFIESNMDFVFNSDSFLKYKSKFYENKTSRYNNEYFNIAVHIRRMGDFERENNRFRQGSHDTPNSYYVNKMNLIREKYHNKKIKFHIYSQGKLEDFKELESIETIFHLNDTVLNTFTDLVFADVLVTCRSSFSYMAALLSNNEIHYLKFWHPPRKDWIVYIS
jgi:hypothetical protein